MPGHSPDTLARPAQRSLVVLRPLGMLVFGALLGLGHETGLLLLFLGAGYWASYYLGRGAAETTE